MQRKILIPAFLAAALPCQQSALAEVSIEDRLESAERKIQSLENFSLDQDRLMQKEPQETNWYDRLEVGGVIEMEAALQDPESGDTESSLTLATVEIGIAVEFAPAVRGEIVLLYEDDGEAPLDVDVAAITLAPEASWFVTAGQFYLPFGSFETGMISDPLTLEIGEIRETALAAGFVAGSLSGTLYLFDGDASEEGVARVDNFGVNLGLTMEYEGFSLVTSLGYINDIGDSDGLIDFAGEVHGPVGGLAFSAVLDAEPFKLIGEYVGASEDFENDQRPSAFNLEAGYGFSLFGRDATLALGIQGTHDAAAVELAERLAMATLSVDLLPGTALGFEFTASDDYAGERTNALLVQLTTQF